MIDPAVVTDYNRSKNELEEFILFAILVAGKTAKTTAINLGGLLHRISIFYSNCNINHSSPFDLIWIVRNELPTVLKEQGFGCYNLKAKTIIELIRRCKEDLFEKPLDLATCSTEDLESIKGIGKKTSRYFILHTRVEANCVPLDTHALKYLRDNQVLHVPKNTPQSKKEYKRLEQEFIRSCPLNMSLAEFDLYIWNLYSSKKRLIIPKIMEGWRNV